MPMLLVVVAFVIGLLVHQYTILHSQNTIALLIIAACTVVACSLLQSSVKSNLIRGVLALFCVFLLGLLRSGIQGESSNNIRFPESPVVLNLVVSDTPQQKDYGVLFSGIVADGSSAFDTKTIRCCLKDAEFLPKVGQTIRVKGRLKPITNKSKGNFNYELWAKSRGITAQMYVDSDDVSLADSKLQTLGAWNRFSVKSKMLRERLLIQFQGEMRKDRVGASTDNYEEAVICAMAFGERTGIGDDMREMFAETGASHLLALSGMHLGILYVLLSIIIVRRRWQFVGQFILIMTIWTYVVLVGMPLSVVRAAIMLTIYSLSTIAGRNKMSVNALCVAALLILLVNPHALWDVGFQMSFMAMIGIFVFFAPIYYIIGAEYLQCHWLIGRLWAMVCVSVAAQITTMPLSVYYFGRMTMMFLLTNFVAIPLVTVLLYAVFLSMIFWFVPCLRGLLVKLTLVASSLFVSGIGMLAKLDFMSINNISINWIQLMLIYMVLICLTVMVVFFVHLRRYTKYREQMTNRFD